VPGLSYPVLGTPVLSGPTGALNGLQAELPGGGPLPPASPWSPRDLVRAVEYLLAALVLLLTAWFGASSTTVFTYQVYWVVLGIGAAALLSFGAMMFVLDGLREIRGRRGALMHSLNAALWEDQASTEVGPADLEHAVASSLMTHYHRRTCPLVRGKAVPLVGLPATHVEAGRVSCGVCAP
jgi:hypothetical protein